MYAWELVHFIQTHQRVSKKRSRRTSAESSKRRHRGSTDVLFILLGLASAKDHRVQSRKLLHKVLRVLLKQRKNASTVNETLIREKGEEGAHQLIPAVCVHVCGSNVR